ncbi:MAG: phenylacetate--CoA ligase family protein [Deltaproteobacteria bacterium]|nr:phenylacetate--CoA ligase family protein [Deltaproteobacteria bacterium]MBW2050725.1 phenylacetate--CoA ligase family protein [Deltaproteobacteria bacterium]MBW2139788.1 phenylacetate--CoA ligase family protein [Deltaproteobacteria bacterium]MBW2322770.1 phenylacetate--CoA ligase family protein [Deltaproteobacteria bacterium]
MDVYAKRNTGYYWPDLEVMTRQARNDYLLNRFGETSENACTVSPEIKDRFDQAGVAPASFRNVKDLEKLPVTRGSGLIEKRLAREDGWTQALYAAGVREGDAALITLSPAMSSLAMALDRSMRSLKVRSIPSGMASVEVQILVMKDLKVDVCVCAPDTLEALADYAEAKDLDIKKELDLKIIFLVVEINPNKSPLILKERLEIPVRWAFGAAELGCLGYECPFENGLHWPDNVLIEVVDPENGCQLEPGQVGEAVITSFDEDYPLFRYGSGKLAAYTDTPCPCGRTTNRWLE